MAAVVLLLNILFSILITICNGRIDSTLLPGQTGASVVQASVRRIQDTCIFPNDHQLLTRLAWATTRFGLSNTTFYNRIDGIWRMEVVDFNQTLNPANFHKQWPSLMQQMMLLLEQNYTAFGYEANSGAMQIPLKNALAARVFFNMLEIQKGSDIPMTIGDQAQWLKSYHGAENITDFAAAVSTMPDSCRTPGADILFIMDASGSIGFSNWKVMVDFVHAVVASQTFNVSDNTYKFAVDVFSDNVYSRITFNGYQNKTDLLSKIDGLKSQSVYTGRGTNTHLALEHAYLVSFTAAAGARDVGRGYPRVAVVLTDGQSNYPSKTQVAAIEARQNGLVLFTVGIGSAVNVNELNFIASTPKCTHMYLLQNFNDLAQNFPDELREQTCRSASTNPTGNNTDYSNSLNQNQYQFFQFGANQTTGITFILRVSTGNITLYFSTLFTQPDEVQYDEMFVVTVGDLGQIYINGSTLQQQPNGRDTFFADFPNLAANGGNLTTVYVSLRGNAPGANSFNLSMAAGNQQVPTTVSSTTLSPSTLTTPTSSSPTLSPSTLTTASSSLPTIPTSPVATTTAFSATAITPNQATQPFDSQPNQPVIFSFSVDNNIGMVVEVAVSAGSVSVIGSSCRYNIGNFLFNANTTKQRQFTLTPDILNKWVQQPCVGSNDNTKSISPTVYIAIRGIQVGDNTGNVTVTPPSSATAPVSHLDAGLIIAITGGVILIAVILLIITWYFACRKPQGRRYAHRATMPLPRDFDHSQKMSNRRRF